MARHDRVPMREEPLTVEVNSQSGLRKCGRLLSTFGPGPMQAALSCSIGSTYPPCSNLEALVNFFLMYSPTAPSRKTSSFVERKSGFFGTVSLS